MVGSVLKATGLFIVSGGVVGVLLGFGGFLYGHMQEDGPGDAILQGQSRQVSVSSGASVVGASLFAAGVGFAMLVAGIIVAGRERDAHARRRPTERVSGQEPPVSRPPAT